MIDGVTFNNTYDTVFEVILSIKEILDENVGIIKHIIILCNIT